MVKDTTKFSVYRCLMHRRLRGQARKIYSLQSFAKESKETGKCKSWRNYASWSRLVNFAIRVSKARLEITLVRFPLYFSREVYCIYEYEGLREGVMASWLVNAIENCNFFGLLAMPGRVWWKFCIGDFPSKTANLLFASLCSGKGRGGQKFKNHNVYWGFYSRYRRF